MRPSRIDRGIKPYPFPIKAPLLNSHMKRWIKSLRVEYLGHFIPVGGEHLDNLISVYIEQLRHEHPCQGIGNRPILNNEAAKLSDGEIRCVTRHGGLLKHYHRAV